MLLRCWRISQGSGVKLRRMKYELSSMERGMEYKTREQFFIFINYNNYINWLPPLTCSKSKIYRILYHSPCFIP